MMPIEQNLLRLLRAVSVALVLSAALGCASGPTESGPPAPQAVAAGERNKSLNERREVNVRLLSAARTGDLPSVVALLDAGANVNARDNSRRSVLMAAIVAGHEVKEQMIQEGLGARVQIVGLPAPAVTPDQRAIIETLIRRGADLEAADAAGKTPLLLAVERDYSQVVAGLLAEGADPDIPTANGLPLVCLAANRGFADTLARLIESGVHLDARGNHGKHAIHYAAEENRLVVVRLLLAHGQVPVDVTSAADWTALHTAVSRGHEEMALLLLEHGADRALITARGWTPEAIAKARGYTNIQAMLVNLN